MLTTWHKSESPDPDVERLVDKDSTYDVHGARIQIHDRHGRDAERPRLNIAFDTGVHSGSFNPLWIMYEVDVLKTIQHDFTAVGCPAIEPVIKRWQTLVQMYRWHEARHEGRALYNCARAHLSKVSPLALKAAEESALPKEYALQKHIELSGNQPTIGGPNLQEEIFYLSRAIFFMTEPRYKEAGNKPSGYDRRVRLREKFTALQRYLEEWAEARVRVQIEQARRYAELDRRRWLEGYDAVIKEESFRSLREVLRFLEDDLNRYVRMGDSRYRVESKKSILFRQRASDGDPKLEREYLARRIGMSSKKFGEYSRARENDARAHNKEVSRMHQRRLEDNSELLEFPGRSFSYPDTQPLQDEFDFWANTVVPMKDRVDVHYRDTRGLFLPRPITLLLVTD